MWTCKKCGEYRFNDTNVCNCQEFVVIDVDDEKHKLHAVSEEDAATKYAKKYNENGDYLLMVENIVVRVNGKIFRLLQVERGTRYPLLV